MLGRVTNTGDTEDREECRVLRCDIVHPSILMGLSSAQRIMLQEVYTSR